MKSIGMIIFLFFGVLSVKGNVSDSCIISFDLHGCDCGAPDCYQTDFRFDLNDIGKEQLMIRIEESGCVEGFSLEGEFKMTFSEGDTFGYYSKEQGSLLFKITDGSVSDAMFVEETRVHSWEDAKSCFSSLCEDEHLPAVYTLRK